MRALPSLFRRISAPEREEGFSLVELIITLSLLLVVTGAMVAIFESVQKNAAFVQERSETLDTMRTAVDQMTKEIRQAKVVTTTSTASRLEMTTYLLGVQKSIVYEVTGENLTRSVDGGTAGVVQENLSSPNLFAYTKDAGGVVQLVGLNLQVHPIRKPNTIVVLASEVRLRNRIAI